MQTHPQLYFSIKHSAGDFTRPAQWNEQLGVGKHAQIVEVTTLRKKHVISLPLFGVYFSDMFL